MVELNEITQYIHCKVCFNEVSGGKIGGVTYRDYQSIEVGFTPHGIQVWCKRHDRSIMHLRWAEDVHFTSPEGVS